jgi:hypothetical protein
MDSIPDHPQTVIPRAETVDVPVNRRLLLRAAGTTGVENPAELVDVALQLLVMPDPYAEFARAHRGSMPDLGIDIF